MVLKQYLMQRYISNETLYYIVPQHHGSAPLLAVKYGLIVIAIRICHMLAISLGIRVELVGWVGLSGLLVVLVGFVYQFMVIYLDSVLITSQGIIIMDQVGLLNFVQTRFDRDSIHSISYQQYGLWDWLLTKGDIIVGIEHGTDYTISNVVYPSKRVDMLNRYKHESIIARAKQIALAEEKVVDSQQYDKFELLVDKLSDIIVDYMKQPRTTNAIIDGDESQDRDDDYPQLYQS